jgi:peptidoglycan/xylan/chitin deacetylase (PgdA/CDA1 family)
VSGALALGAAAAAGVGYSLAACRITRPLLWDRFHDHVHWRGPATERARFALSFDDGPHPDQTPALLEILGRHRARATFFLLGREVVRYPGLVAQIAAAGHEIGNHSFSHAKLPLLPTAAMAAEIDRASAAIGAACGAEPRLFRPPFGLRDPRLLRATAERGLALLLWSVMPWDWLAPPAPWIAAWLERRVRPGAIVTLHDGGGDRSATLAALEQQLPRWAGRGWHATSCGELLQLSAAGAASGEPEERC